MIDSALAVVVWCAVCIVDRWRYILWSKANQLLWFRVASQWLVVVKRWIWWMLPLPAWSTVVPVSNNKNKRKYESGEKTMQAKKELVGWWKVTLNHFLPEAWHFTTIVWTMMKTAHRTQCILQIWINLHLFRELRRLDLNECRSHCLHVWPIAIECNTARTNWILMLVGINT